MSKVAGWLFALFVMLGARQGFGFEPYDYAFLLSAQAVANPPTITLSWAQNPSRQITVRRKLPTDTTWTSTLATLPANSTSFTDNSVEPGKVYEYQLTGVLSTAPVETAYGYIAAGIEIPATDYRGKVVLIVDNTHASSLANELETLRQDLIGDGWSVVRRDVSPNNSPTYVKSQIQAEHTADPNNVRAVFLIGHVPVPYSGILNPDMHANHLGAWPADVYYGDIDGTWTDSTAYKTGSQYPSNDNVPGDGKFDQSIIPSTVELYIGRIDMSALPLFAPRTEQELLRNYLNKNHRFRHAQITLPPRGLIRDSFRIIDDDVPAADAWRAFPALFGPNNSHEVGFDNFIPTLGWQGYLWAYGGGGGDFVKADGVGTSANFAATDPQAFFYLLHGSYFGDWNTKDNLLRSAIATPNFGLVSIWSSLPHWYFQQVALGEPIGHAVRLVQNNRGLYKSQTDYSFGEVHISIMGDPTLRSFILAPPANPHLNIANRKVQLTWNGAAPGYAIYRSPTMNGPFTRLNTNPISATQFEEPAPASDCIYMIRSAALQTTGSGSFQNLSQGIFIAYTAPPFQLSAIAITATDSSGDENGDQITFQITRTSPTDSELDITIEATGAASESEDYDPIAKTIHFAANQSAANITITPKQDAIAEVFESITITIKPSSAYTISTSTATANIAASGESRFTTTTISATGELTLTASGFANRPYRIESRPPDSGWTTRQNGTSSPTGEIIYRQNISSNNPCEIYRLVWD